MQLIGYKAYQKGYFGCLETDDDYICFLFSKNTFRAVTTYAKEDFTSQAHFRAMLHKFLPRRFFLPRPVPVPSLTSCDLAAAARRLTSGATGKVAPGSEDHTLVSIRQGRG
jgi:hypothetical protein